MIYTLAFDPPDVLMSLNDREHWGPHSAKVKNWRQAAKLHAVNQINLGNLKRNLPRSIVKVSYPVKSLKVRRDPSNLFPTTKAIIDGFVDAGVWRDDTSKEVATTEPRLHLASIHPKVYVDIEVIKS